MRRRKLVALVGVFTLLTIVFLAIGVIGVGIGTDPGREQIRSLIQQQVSGQVNGKIHIGKVGGSLLRGFTLDSFAIRGPDDSLFLSTGRIRLDYDPRDLMDRRLLLRNVEVEHPVFRLRQHENGDWNFQRIFRNDGPSAPGVPGRKFGDFVVLDSVNVRNGSIILIRPWEPDDSLSGARRDSAIRVNLANTNREIRRSAEGFTHVYRWTRMTGLLPHVRIADPDSNRFGMEFIIADLKMEEQEPPFSFRNARGVVRKLGDTVFVEARHFDLPASTGSASGKIWWGSGLPVRVDMNVIGDSVSLKDVAWVYETLPRTGGGRTKLRIRNNPRNMDDFQFELSEMDVRSTRSRVTGAMTFVTGGPVLEVRDVDLRGAPVNFDLVRTFAGEPLPVDWQGDLYGYVRGPGGPLTHFVVSESDITFRDAHVPGAISRASGSGGLDILEPELTKFRGFDVNVESLDLRSIQYLFPAFLELGGTVSGTATLDSSWLDVRFSKGNVVHRNGPGEPSRVTGSGRVTYGEEFMTYDLTVNAEPVSLTMLSNAYPLHLKGLMSGPVRARGTTNDLQLTMDLQGPAGRITYSGRVDAYPLSVAAHGTGRLEGLSLSQLLDRPNAPAASMTGAFELGVRVDTSDLATLQGTAAVTLERSEFDGIRVYPSRIRARFADRRIFVDTLRIESVAATITASGALGLSERTSDSLVYHIGVDSLGGIRRYVSKLTSAWAEQGAGAIDSLGGSLTLLGTARGSLTELDIAGRVLGTDVFVRREAGREVSGSFALSNVFKAPTGTASIRFDTLNVGGILLDTLGATARLDAGRTGTFVFGTLARNGVTLTAAGELALGEDGTNDVIVRDMRLVTDSSRWTLRGPAHIRSREDAFGIDSLVLVSNRAGRVALSGFVPDSGHARFFFRADSVSLHDVGRIAQLKAPFSGVAHVTMQGAGTGDSPVMNLQATLDSVRYGGLRVDRVRGIGEYVNRRAQVSLDLARHGRNALFARGSLPIELKYFGARLTDDSLRGTIRTDSAQFDIIEAVVPGLREATGSLVANIDIAGSWDHPDVAGTLKVDNGAVIVDALGVRLDGVHVDIGLFGHRDSLAIRRLVAHSGQTPGDSVAIRGYVLYNTLQNPYLNLRMDSRGFRAFNRRDVAEIFMSTERDGIRLRGDQRVGMTVTGGLIVDRGTIYLPDPELARKRRIDLTQSQFADTTAQARAIMPQPPSRLMQSLLLDGVRVTLGDEVWLRSREANIKLAGALTVERAPVKRLTLGPIDGDSIEYQALLDGVLVAERGTYNLALGYALQREFEVESGTITFYPVAGLVAELNINALHTVRTQTSSDLRIRVRLTGPITNPIVSLESAESFAVSPSDLVSYLIFGQPNFELGNESKDYARLAMQTLFPSAQTFAAAQLRGFLGSWTDFVQLRLGSTDVARVGEGATRREAIEEFFWTSRVGAERQLTDNFFVSVSTGLCPFREDPSSSGEFLEGLSGKIEWRLSRDASIRAGKEPSAMTCRPGASLGRVVPTPSQWGLSLFKTWRF
jgi:translocation and assembly module TamB